MIDEATLRDVLVLFAEMHKRHYEIVYAVMNELSSVRDTVRGLDPTFADVLEEKRKDYAEGTLPARQKSLDACNEIIQRLKDGEVC